jgi:hypothetical protein
MAILVVADAAGMTAEQDVLLIKALDLEGSPPAGARIRVAGPTADGWRMVSLWESQADFERFRDERLVPVLTDTGHAMQPPEIWPIETVLTYHVIGFSGKRYGVLDPTRAMILP